MDKIYQILKHLEKEIIYCNYSDLEGEEFVNAINENSRRILDEFKDKDSKSLLLVDVNGTYVTTSILEAFKKSAAEIKPFIKKSAVIGISGIQKIHLETVNNFSNLFTIEFSTIDDAKDWLVKD